jgi:1,4-alpha-glucan branching enzyme
VVVLNATPVPRADYRIGVSRTGAYRVRLSSDDARYGGSGYPTEPRLETEPVPLHGRACSLVLTLPPLAAVVLIPEAAGGSPPTRPA